MASFLRAICMPLNTFSIAYIHYLIAMEEDMNRQHWAVMGAVIVMSSLSVGLVFLNPQVVQGQEAAGWLALDSELQRMEPYVRVRSSGDFPVQTLDADAALRTASAGKPWPWPRK